VFFVNGGAFTHGIQLVLKSAWCLSNVSNA
jgi:hypothetical protein